MDYQHQPVMLSEVLEALSPKPGGKYLDCTLGGASYTTALARATGKKGKVVSMDADSLAIDNAQKILKEKKIDNVILVHDNFRNLDRLMDQGPFDGIVFDLGLSSAQLDDKERSFSFQGDRPLDMAFGAGAKVDTAGLINSASASELRRIFLQYGEEKRAARIAQAIVDRRKKKKFRTSKDLSDLIIENYPPRSFYRIHPATKVFQALRLATNDELGALKEALEKAVQALKKGGRLVLVSFHSGEDRIVKQFFRQESRDCICPPQAPVCTCHHQASLALINKKPISPSLEEVEDNPRSRSAKLRAAIKIC